VALYLHAWRPDLFISYSFDRFCEKRRNEYLALLEFVIFCVKRKRAARSKSLYYIEENILSAKLAPAIKINRETNTQQSLDKKVTISCSAGCKILYQFRMSDFIARY